MRLRDVLLAALLLVAPAMRADDPASTIREFFQAHANERPLTGFWASSAPGREPFEKAARAVHRVRCSELAGVRIDRTRIDGDTAVARATIVVVQRERATERVWGPTPIEYDMSLVREPGGWRIASATPAAETLALGLIAAKTPEARQALLDAAPELVNPELVRHLMKRAHAVGNIPDMAEAGRINVIAGGIASSIDDRGGLALHQAFRSVEERLEGRMENARSTGTLAVELARESGEADILVRALNNLSRVLDRRQADDFRTQILNEALTLENRVEDLSLIAKTLNQLEAASWETDNYLSLRRILDEEIRICELVGDALCLSVGMVNVASLYDDLRDYAACVQYARRGATHAHPVSPGGMYIVARIIESRCLRQHGEHDAARVLAGQSLEMARQSKHQEHLQAYALVELAHHHVAAREYDTAVALLRESLALIEARGDQSDEQHLLIARIHLDHQRYEEALVETRLFRESRVANNASAAVISKTYDARAHRALGDPAAALADLDEAMAASERWNMQLVGDERQRSKGLSIAAEAFAEAVDLNIELGRVETALACAERARGQILLDSLRNGTRRVSKSMTAQEQETERRLEEEIAALNRLVARGGDTADARRKLEQARIDYESFRTTLYVRHPQLKTQRGAIPVAPVASMIEALPDRGAFVEYVVGEKSTHAFVVTGTPEQPVVRAFTLPVTRKQLEEKVTAYRSELAARAIGQRHTARALDAILLAPLDEVLHTKRVLGIVADGVLWQLPFEALVDAGGKYRIERHTIFYAPSISVFLEMRKTTREGGAGARPTLLAVGDPLVSGSMRRQLSAVYRATELSPLPDAKTEVEKLRSIYGRDAAVYVGAAATEARVKAEIERHEVLHFATHGILDDSSPMYSRLLLAEGKNATGSDADGLLEAWELMGLDLDADLVVMSSCDSARGSHSAGEGLIGMTWAAFVAGARTTVASLWKVSSKSTSTLMVDFHRQLRGAAAGPLAKAEALRQAKLRMLRSGRQQKHPFYWAPFVVIGDP